MKSKEEVELELSKQKPNWPGYPGKLEFRPIRFEDSRLLIPVIRKDKGVLSAYLSKFRGSSQWNIHDAQRLVSSLVNGEWPETTYLFHINNEPIGLITISGVSQLDECQLILAVFPGHQGKGFATAMTQTILKITEEVWGFGKTWWFVDATNRASIKVANKTGFTLHSHYEETDKRSPDKSSGFYLRLVKNRPNGLSPGVLQGGDVDYWTIGKNQSLLEVVIESKNKKAKEEQLGSSIMAFDQKGES
jgi:RimJ/RimL family protein N-acetyltransferase